MKELFVVDVISHVPNDSEVVLYGWVKSKRDLGGIVFIDLSDSTGSVQLVFDREKLKKDVFDTIKNITKETALKVTGIKQKNNNSAIITITDFEIIGFSKFKITPNVRDEIDIFSPELQEHLMSNRHFYIRNEKYISILKFRSYLMGKVHNWFRENRFTEITAPILTPTPLYDDGSALSLDINGQTIFLTQCVGFYLDSAVHAFERVYNIGPSFRGEEGRSKRHLMEYWHIKAEIAFCNLEEIISFVEKLISEVSIDCINNTVDIVAPLRRRVCIDGINPPYPRIDYCEAIEYLQKRGVDIKFGKSLGTNEEAILSKMFDKPFWVVGIPRTIEPFPYSINPDDIRRTMTADLIASKGYGELLGVAEKIYKPEMLDERLVDKNKFKDPRYQWLRDIRNYGCIPHAAFGMGTERLIRWLLDIPHVRDTIPYFRTFGRKIEP